MQHAIQFPGIGFPYFSRKAAHIPDFHWQKGESDKWDREDAFVIAVDHL